jgi:biopolymer transport protein TolR
LQDTAQRNPDTEVQLRADQTIAYGRVVEVMGLAQQAGLSRIGFVAEAPQNNTPR